MAITWRNTFDGPDGVTITAANSVSYGDAIASTAGSTRYSTDWAAHGTSSVQMGSDDGQDIGELHVPDPSGAVTTWSLRMYLLIPAGGSVYITRNGHGIIFADDEFSTCEILGQSHTADLPKLIGATVRLEVVRTGGTATARLWWTDPASPAAPDREVVADSSGWTTFAQTRLTGGGYSQLPCRADEIAIAQGEWIGPVVQQHETGAAPGRIIIRGHADGWASGLNAAPGRIILRGRASGHAHQYIGAPGRIIIRGHADGLAGATEATAPPVEDMWLGPLGLMHRMAERGDWERTPDLGIETHVSLHGQITASRARWAPRTTALTWDRLTRTDADALAEIALLHARADSTVCVIDPDADNLLTREQSRGRPLAGSAPAATEDLYRLSGTGGVTVGLVSGVRHACTQEAAAGDDLTWLHPYYGTRGWPLMPGWPVYLRATTVGGTVAASGRLWLTFRDWTGAVISSAAGLVGSGTCEADAPAGAVTVTPHMVLSESLSGLRLIGEASLSYAPPDPDARPLGNGCPVYTVVGLSDTPQLPWRTTSLQLQEVRAFAAR